MTKVKNIFKQFILVLDLLIVALNFNDTWHFTHNTENEFVIKGLYPLPFWSVDNVFLFVKLVIQLFN